MDAEVTLWQVKLVDVVILSILVQFFNMFVSRHVKFLRDIYTSPAVVWIAMYIFR